MRSRTITTCSSLAVAGAIIIGGAGTASATDSSQVVRTAKHTASTSTDSTASRATTTKDERDHRRTQRTLTAAQKERAGAAALATVPGTVHHVRTGRDGGYVVIVTTTGGTRTAVTLDKDFTVTGTRAAKDRSARDTKDAGARDSKGSRSTSGTRTAA